MIKSIFWLVLTSFLLVQGCTSHVTSDEYLTHKVRDPVYLQPFENAKWFRPDKHRLSEIRIQHDDLQVSKGVHLTVEGALNTVLYFGGYPFSSTVDEVTVAGQFALLGVNFISVKNRGLDSDGNWPTVRRLQHDTINIYDQVSAMHPEDFIILHGSSVSTFFVAELARTRDVDAIVLEGALTRIDEAVQVSRLWSLPWLLPWQNDIQIEPQLAALDNYPTLLEYRGPLLLLVGEADNQAPPALTQLLYQASPSVNKSIAVVQGAEQGDVISQDKALEAYMMFIHRYAME
ncbi:alpha/beta hydrolase [Photobacterium sp. SDRW27]|uniref:alpha/beta hydrolase family protein n=1 Tax=Photobacterium obscurum TaxID=2829490 RepID=UPI002243C218|nr:alpha/beta hydrolase [Photobacterium obscurum]MCW8329428.1 alpha/beta hydrolase [Photobacterium obscurum]